MGPLLLIALAAGVLFMTLGKKSSGTPGAGQVIGPNGQPQTPSTTAGMTPDQIKAAVATALQVETDPSKLQEFADSLLPDYASYSKQLSARAKQLSTPGPMNGVIPQPAVYPSGPSGSLPMAPQVVPPPPAPLYVPPPAPPPPPVAPAPEPEVVPNDPPTPEAFPDVGSTAYVVTHDTGPSGNLNIRSAPSSSGAVLSQVGHGTSVTIEGAIQNGWYPVTTPSGVEGYASANYLAALPPDDGGGDLGQELVAADGQALAEGSSA